MNNPRRPIWSRLLAVISGSTTVLNLVTLATAAALITLISI